MCLVSSLVIFSEIKYSYPMRRFPKIILTILVLSLCVGCDQATKNLAQETLPLSQTISYLGGIVQLQYAENPGAMLGLGATLPPAVRVWTLIILNGVGIVGTNYKLSIY